MPSSLADHGRATCRVGAGQLFIAYEDKDCVLNGSEMDCVSNPVVKPLAVAWAAAKLRPWNDLPLTSILHHCLSPSHLTPNLFISGALLLLRTETLGHSIMCWENPEPFMKRQAEPFLFTAGNRCSAQPCIHREREGRAHPPPSLVPWGTFLEALMVLQFMQCPAVKRGLLL